MSETPAIELVRSQLEPCVTVPELAEIWGCGKRLIYDGVKKDGWPHRMEGRTIKFSVADIREIRELQRRVIEPRRPAARKRPGGKPRRKASV